MYFWNINALVDKLKTNSLSSYEQIQYYLVILLFTYGSFIGKYAIPHGKSLITSPLYTVPAFIGMLLVFCGALYCYKINQRGDDQQFMVRMACLLVTCSIRYAILGMLYSIPVLIIAALTMLYIPQLAILMHASADALAITINVFNCIIGICWTIGLYWYIGKQFKKIAQSPESIAHEYQPRTTA